jgi:3',5'-cyclic AMP phosphodiesterase CpdA
LIVVLEDPFVSVEVPSTNSPIRLAHFSDLHLPVKLLGWRWRDLFSKRLTGWVNTKWLGRGKKFQKATQVIEALVNDLHQRQFNHLVFTGDASMLGFPIEFEAVAKLLHIGDATLPPGIAVPGNHDQYTAHAVRKHFFETTFAPWQVGERIDDHTYPFAQRVGHLWLIGVNSSRPNRIPWDSRGGVGKHQRQRLEALLKRLSPGPRILVTHYPLRIPDGRPESLWRRLRDWKRVLEIAKVGGVSLWLHGHRHTRYLISTSDDMPFPCICVGSTTQEGRWSYNEYEVQDHQLRLLRREYDPQTNRFVDRETTELTLRK